MRLRYVWLMHVDDFSIIHLHEPRSCNCIVWIWVIYFVALLAVLLAHTVWVFSRFDPQTRGRLGLSWGAVIAWAVAFAFEAAIAALTHQPAKRTGNQNTAKRTLSLGRNSNRRVE